MVTCLDLTVSHLLALMANQSSLAVEPMALELELMVLYMAPMASQSSDQTVNQSRHCSDHPAVIRMETSLDLMASLCWIRTANQYLLMESLSSDPTVPCMAQMDSLF